TSNLLDLPTAEKKFVTRTELILHLDKNYLGKVWEDIPEISVQNKWVTFDKYIKDNRKRLRDRSLFLPQSLIKTSKGEINANVYIDTMLTKSIYSKCCKIISIQDLSKERERALDQYNHKLTGLPNEIKAVQDLPALYSKVHVENNKVAIVLLDIDNFTRLRSVIGYEQANTILLNFANHLKEIELKMHLKIYHTSENHFLLTLSNVGSVDEIYELIDTIQKDTVAFYSKSRMSLNFSFSTGIALYPDSGTIRELLDNVYKALAHAQKDGFGKKHLYLPDGKENKYNEITLHNDMQVGLDRGEFEVYYQPIVDVNTKDKEIVGAEALIRWHHHEYGMIPPDAFIPLMEQTGFIIKLGQFVLDTVCEQQKKWEMFDFKPIEVSINVSMVEIISSNFVTNIKNKLEKHKLSPKLIKFEITEGMAMIDEGDTQKYFKELKTLGVGISLDDFGTGYTSFTYLKKFPADVIKIDKSLVDYIVTSKEDQGIVKGIIALGHDLGMKVLIEGVEDAKMVAILESYHADYIQGYFFGKPLPSFEFQKSLRIVEEEEETRDKDGIKDNSSKSSPSNPSGSEFLVL
ncbi:MAG: GGDEF domain-containing phosphodiesterase, partial [Sulfurovum sp.]